MNPVHLKPADSFPRIIWGRFMKRGHGHVMSLNVQVHHGLADGLHISALINTFQDLCSAPDAGFSPATKGRAL
ncbi:CatA-like O-acetyltransferase [Desulfonatronum sp. SC1]|uniref:CatA-like O-acetyltransferase n=1 Tax=Desulfonatronum sp. SC1 TaxID=2109626 RepID=UPI0034D1B5D6